MNTSINKNDEQKTTEQPNQRWLTFDKNKLMKNCQLLLTRLFADENFLLYSILLQCYSVYVTLIGSTGFTVDDFKVQHSWLAH